ncbi:hypothetical protein CW368_12130 [Actinomycetales bacterium SN12]|nr:hypothetical protein CW368_12130 [Actinomycetales bacterium SN12]
MVRRPAGTSGTVGAFASRWEDAELALGKVLSVLRDAERSLGELDGRTVRALRERFADLVSVAEDGAQWTGATASAIRAVSQIIESTRVLICDFLGRLSRFAQDLFGWSLNPLSKLNDIERFANSAAEFIAVGGALVKSLIGAVVSLAQLLYELAPLIGDALHRLRGVIADMMPALGGPLGFVAGNVLDDFLDTDVNVREIDPESLPTVEQRRAWDRAHEVTSLDSLSDLVGVNTWTDAMGGQDSSVIDVKRVRVPDGSKHWVVSMPSTQSWEFDGPHGAMNDRDSNLALMLDNPFLRGQYERAVLQAMKEAGIPEGADVVLTGFSQGGIMAANLAADPAFPYRPIGVVTNGSPIDNFRVPPHIPVYAFQHATDVVPMTDGSAVAVPGLPGIGPADVPNSLVTVLPPNMHQITLPDPPGEHLSLPTTTVCTRSRSRGGSRTTVRSTTVRIRGTWLGSAGRSSITRSTREWSTDEVERSGISRVGSCDRCGCRRGRADRLRRVRQRVR